MPHVSFVPMSPDSRQGAWISDDTLESPLTELGLIKALDINDRFRFVRGPKATLGDGVFTYALMDFWSLNTDAATLSFETIAHAPGGPGRVFKLDEDDVVDRLTSIDDVTEGALQWSETAGLKQVNRKRRTQRCAGIVLDSKRL